MSRFYSSENHKDNYSVGDCIFIGKTMRMALVEVDEYIVITKDGIEKKCAKEPTEIVAIL